MRNASKWIGILVVLSFSTSPAASGPHPRRVGLRALSGREPLIAQGGAPERDSIRKEDLRADLFFLAGDGMRGRLTGTPENLLAADFIKSRFERLGLAPAGPESSYYQPYNLTAGSLGPHNQDNQLEIVEGERSLKLQSVQDFYPLRFSPSGQVRGGIVYAGFGITSASLGYDDYRGPSLAGKIVLALDHEPGERDPESPFDGAVTAEAANVIRKTLAAQERGAAAVLFVSDVHNHPGTSNFAQSAKGYWPDVPRRTPSFTLSAWAERVRIPALQISQATASLLVRGTRKSLEELSRAAETPKGMTPMPIPGVEVRLSTGVSRLTFSDRNVVALLEGSDAQLKDEWVVVCAHFDHDGADGTQIWNGADDNGSGTVALLEIAEAYALAARSGQRPRRSVLFAAWNSEERGLLGAWAYTEAPLHPLEKTVAVLNMDMIGRNEEVPEGGGARFRGLVQQTAESNRNTVNVMGFSRSPELTAILKKANDGIGLDLLMRYDNNPSNLVRRSDQWPFLQNGVPAVGFLTGLHPDYHTVFDRPEKINYDKMEKIARLVYQASRDLAQQTGRPRLGAGAPTP